MQIVNQVPVSVVVPIFNEQDNIELLYNRLASVLEAGGAWEVIFVDDGSTDDSLERLARLRRQPGVVVVQMATRQGQSAAIYVGVQYAKYPQIVTMDGDGQNDPQDIPILLEALNRAPSPVLVAGIRVTRKDSLNKRLSSRIANSVRQSLLKDDCVDTGCGLKAFQRDLLLQIPLFDHMHRFLPALFKHCLGATIVSVPVRHHPRIAGQSKYGIGNRLWVGLKDIIGVRWLISRYKTTQATVSESPCESISAIKKNRKTMHS